MDWTRWEREWYEKSFEHLADHVSLAEEINNFIEHIATHHQIVNAQRTQSRRLERSLMRRLGEEYRAIELLATRGHGLQAISACANIFELAHTLGYIVNRDDLAKEWFASENRSELPWKIRTLVERNSKNLGWDQKRCKEEYGRYGFACGFKHNNPLFTRVINLPIDPDLYLGQFAIAEGANLALVGVGLVSFFRLEGDDCSTALQAANGFFDRAASLLPHIVDVDLR